MNNVNQGVAVFEPQAIKISGGTIPKIVSDAKNIVNTNTGECASTMLFSMAFISIKKYSRKNNNPIIIRIIRLPLIAVFFKKA